MAVKKPVSNDGFGKVKGHVGEAKGRFEADAKQRADAEAATTSTILTDKMLQSGQWDSGKVLYTTLNGGKTAYRKTLTRTAPDAVAGVPTMGGLGVLDSMDEEQYKYTFLGYGHAMPADGGFAPAPMVNRGDANIGAGEEFRFLIEPEEPAGHPDGFDVRNHDVMYLLLGTGPTPPKLAFEVVGIETTSNIPPYTTRYLTNRRNDLDLVTPGDYEQAQGG